MMPPGQNVIVRIEIDLQGWLDHGVWIMPGGATIDDVKDMIKAYMLIERRMMRASFWNEIWSMWLHAVNIATLDSMEFMGVVHLVIVDSAFVVGRA